MPLPHRGNQSVNPTPARTSRPSREPYNVYKTDNPPPHPSLNPFSDPAAAPQPVWRNGKPVETPDNKGQTG